MLLRITINVKPAQTALALSRNQQAFAFIYELLRDPLDQEEVHFQTCRFRANGLDDTKPYMIIRIVLSFYGVQRHQRNTHLNVTIPSSMYSS